jgi:molybdopterin synthase sulfur carrier subunit
MSFSTGSEVTMQVRVKLYANLSRTLSHTAPGIPFEFEVPHGATVGDLVNELKLPREEVKLFFVNGRARPIDWPLEPGDEVGIFPLIGGG